MTQNNLRAVFLSLLMILSVVAVGATPVAAQADGEINVVLEPTDQDVQPDGTTTYDVVVQGNDADVTSYEATIEIADPNVAEITALDDAYDDGTGSVSIADDNSSVTFDRALFGSSITQTNFTVATVTLSAGATEDTTTLSVSDAELSGSDGIYTNNELGSADLTVNEAAGGDGGTGDINVVLEPRNQEVEPEGTVTYDVVVQGNNESFSAYEATIEIADPNVAEITALDDAYDDGQGAVSIADDNSSVTFDRALFGTSITQTNLTLATVTVSAADIEADTTLSVTNAQIGDYTNNELGSASVTVVRPEFPDVTGNGEPAKDPDGDGFPEDVNGEGGFDIFDIQSLYDLLT